MTNGCPKCEKLEFGLCIDCQIEQAEWEAMRWQDKVEELKKKKAEEKNITDIKTIAEMYKTHEPLCPECGRRAFPTNFPPECFGGKKYDKRTVWFCSDMGHCTFAVDENTKWQLKKKKEQESVSANTEHIRSE